MEPSEDIARMRAEMDQAAAGMQELAKALWAFFSELCAQGFDEAQAMRLTAIWLREMTAKSSEPEE